VEQGETAVPRPATGWSNGCVQWVSGVSIAQCAEGSARHGASARSARPGGGSGAARRCRRAGGLVVFGMTSGNQCGWLGLSAPARAEDRLFLAVGWRGWVGRVRIHAHRWQLVFGFGAR